ncbi:MAG TPA: RsiV family protein [Ignavibacteria bacterium]|nr:RsiV family protein [Ignavibacteria bacterium]HRK00319.1 RsiV family protein [Ignavibacteria bacterium]
MKKLTALFLFCIILVSCGKEEPRTEVKTKDSESPSSGNIEFVMKEFSKSYNNCNKDSTGCTYISFKYPEILNENLKSNVNRVIGSFLKDSIYSSEGKSFKDFDELAVSFFADYDTMKKLSSVKDIAFALDGTAEIVSETKDNFTVSVNCYIFIGGAHPNSYMSYIVFGKRSGDVLSLNNIFKPGYDSLLNKLIDEAFRKQKGLSPTDNLQTKGNLFENKITHNNNFMITNDSISFYYNNYEIAAYVFGPTEITVPLSGMKEYLKD